MNLSKIYREFFNSEKAGGLILIFATIVSIGIANSEWGKTYIDFWHADFGGHSIVHWINDGLMAVFFLLIGLELEREMYRGELSDIKDAALPVLAALGGMLFPAGIYLLFNFGQPTQGGAGIPMATDIAFAIGILSLLGKRVPSSLKVFLTALAVIDDLGAILVIAIFYTGTFSLSNLLIALGIWGGLMVLNRLKVNHLTPYLVGGVLMWYFMLHSGIHATIAGVLLAFAIPFGDGGEKSPSYRLQHVLHKPVAFVVLPLFALANTCIAISPDWTAGLSQVSSLGILAGLIIGKPLGIFLFSLLGVGLGVCSNSPGMKWKNIIGVGFLSGIGFTMSIFITLLAFNEEGLITSSKIAIMAASLIAGTIGYVFLASTLKTSADEGNESA